MTGTDLDALCRLVAESEFARWRYDHTVGEEGRAAWVAEQSNDHNLRADVAVVYEALKAERDHLIALLGNCAAGLRLSLAGHTDAATPLENIDAARELLRQADEALANYEGAPWVTS